MSVTIIRECHIDRKNNGLDNEKDQETKSNRHQAEGIGTIDEKDQVDH